MIEKIKQKASDIEDACFDINRACTALHLMIEGCEEPQENNIDMDSVDSFRVIEAILKDIYRRIYDAQWDITCMLMDNGNTVEKQTD